MGRAWADELAAWARLEETWDMLQFGLRIGENPQVIVTSTPRGLRFLRELEKEGTGLASHGPRWPTPS
jgi:phage terminase large subunit-like protein